MILNQPQPLMEHLVEHEDVYVTTSGRSVFKVSCCYGGVPLDFQCVPSTTDVVKVILFWPSIEKPDGHQSTTYHSRDTNMLVGEGKELYRKRITKKVSDYFTHSFKQKFLGYHKRYHLDSFDANDPVAGGFFSATIVDTEPGNRNILADLNVSINFEEPKITLSVTGIDSDFPQKEWQHLRPPTELHYPIVIKRVVKYLQKYNVI